jgi:hypothetical protein
MTAAVKPTLQLTTALERELHGKLMVERRLVEQYEQEVAALRKGTDPEAGHRAQAEAKAAFDRDLAELREANRGLKADQLRLKKELGDLKAANVTATAAINGVPLPPGKLVHLPESKPGLFCHLDEDLADVLDRAIDAWADHHEIEILPRPRAKLRSLCVKWF